jgi:hypothetical protein
MPSSPFSLSAGRRIAHGWVLALSALGPAAAQPGPAVPVQCIGEEPLAMPEGAQRAWLDEGDRAAVLAALQARFPAVARDGLDATALLLWRHGDGDWRYAALVASPGRPGARCVAASFSAASIPQTAGLLRKYFFASGAAS